MSGIEKNYFRLRESIAAAVARAGRSLQEVSLVAVTKNQSVKDILELYRLGCRHFAENRVQELLAKKEAMPQDCLWDLIGTLQKNKVRKAIENAALIQSVDTVELAKKISALSEEKGIKIPVLLQVNASCERTKHGLTIEEWKKEYPQVSALPGIHIQGLMTMAPLTENRLAIRQCFAAVRRLREELPGIGPDLSMGMSHDYEEAIEEGATIIRVGSLLFIAP